MRGGHGDQLVLHDAHAGIYRRLVLRDGKLVGAVLVGAAVARSLAYAWGVPCVGVHHMEGHLLAPLLEALVTAGGLDDIKPAGRFFEQALWRGSLRGWFASGEAEAHGSIPAPEEANGDPEPGQA